MTRRGLAAAARALTLAVAACSDGGLPRTIEPPGPSQGPVSPPPPETFITEAPPPSTTDSNATFRFSSPTATHFECRLDDPRFVACEPPMVYDLASTGPHAFEVRAAVGETVDPTPASHAWRVESPYPDIAIIEANDAWTETEGGWLLDEVEPRRLASNFFDAHPDVYDFLVVWTDFPTLNANPFGGPLRLDVAGIGYEQRYEAPLGTDYTHVTGSSGTLQAVAFMNDKASWESSTVDVLDGLAHEVGHRWLAFVPLLGEPDPWVLLCASYHAHWNLLVGLDEPSPMGRHFHWTQDNGDGTFTAFSPSPTAYSSLDLYLMGLLPPADVPDFFFVRDPHDFEPPLDPLGEPWHPDSPVLTSVTFAGERVDVSVGEVVATLGTRVPSWEEAQTSFRQAFVLVVPPGSGASLDTLQWVDGVRLSWEASFSEASRGLGTIDTTLD